MSDTTIDLSAGFVPKQSNPAQPNQPPAQATAPSTAIDLSAGLVPKDTSTDQSNVTTPAATANQPESTLGKAGTVAEDVGAGILKGADKRSTLSVDSLVKSLPVLFVLQMSPD